MPGDAQKFNLALYNAKYDFEKRNIYKENKDKFSEWIKTATDFMLIIEYLPGKTFQSFMRHIRHN